MRALRSSSIGSISSDQQILCCVVEEQGDDSGISPPEAPGLHGQPEEPFQAKLLHYARCLTKMSRMDIERGADRNDEAHVYASR